MYKLQNWILLNGPIQLVYTKKPNVIKGTMSRDFLLLFFFMNQFPPSPKVSHEDRFDFFRKFSEIFASQGAPPVSTTPVANLPPMSTTPTAKLSPVSTTLAANLPLVSTTPAANFATSFASVVDTGGAPSAANISGNFRKNSKRPFSYTQGPGETDS